MNITKLSLNRFMPFDRLELEFSSGINVIYGDNSTGKTTLLKTMYAILQAYHKSPADITKKEMEVAFARKFQGVFRPDQNNVGRLVSRKQGSNRTEIQMELAGNRQVTIDFTNRSSRRVNVSFANKSLLAQCCYPNYIKRRISFKIPIYPMYIRTFYGYFV